MDKLSERIFEALLTEFILGFIGYIVGDQFTKLLLVGLGALIAATIAFSPKIILNLKNSAKTPQAHGIAQPITTKGYQDFAVWFQWVLTNVAGFIAIARMMSAFPPTSSGTQLITDIALLWISGGAIAGLLQWIILRKQFSNASQWLVATFIGWGLAGAAGQATSVIIVQSNYDVFINYIGYISFLAAGLTLGLSQWLVLKERFQGAKWWIFAQIAGLIITTFAFDKFQISTDGSLRNDTIFGLLIGFFDSFITGITLVYLLKRPLARSAE